MNYHISSGLLIALLLVCRCMNLAGGGTDIANARVYGSVVTQDGKPVSHARVQIIPAGYDPLLDPRIPDYRTDTTDDRGVYGFPRVDSGTFTIQIVHPAALTRALTFGVRVEAGDSVLVPADTLRKPGAIKVMLPVGVDAVNGYVYVPGTTFAALLNENSSQVMLDTIPAGTIPALWYAEKNRGTRKPIRYDVQVAPENLTVIQLPAWGRSKRLFLNTTASGAAVSGNVTDFPVLLKLINLNFDFSRAKADGGDLRFTKPDGTPLPFEIERWDAALSLGEVWVRVDTIFGNDSAHYFIMYWDNPYAVAGSDGGAVFDTSKGFQAVWHLGQNTGTPARDATLNHYDGTPSDTAPVQVPGAIGMAQRFNGISSYLHMKNTAGGTLNFPENGSYSISAWVCVDTSDTNYHLIVGKGNEQYHMKLTCPSLLPKQWWEFAEYHTGAGWLMTSKPAAYKSWKYLVGKREGSRQHLYLDGAIADSVGKLAADSLPRNTGNDVSIGKYLTSANRSARDNFDPFCGMIDEVCIAGVARSGDWIKLCYMNQKMGDRLVVFR